MDFGLVTIHFRRPEAIQELLAQSAHWDCPPAHTIVVDNSAGSVGLDGRGLAGCEIVPAPDNPGYAAAANIGIARLRELGVRYALVMTQEARLSAEGSRLLGAALANDPQAAVAAPILEYVSAPGVVFSAGGDLLADAQTRHRAQGEPRATLADPGAPYGVDWADGAVLLLDLDATARVGDFDTAYFLYVEEIDLQLALRTLGYRVLLVPQAIGWQEPGRYPTYLRFRNSRYLTDKFTGVLRPYPWRRVILRDAAKRVIGRGARWDLAAALQGVDAARCGRMGNPDAPPERVTILCEFTPEELHTGVAGRLRHAQAMYPDAQVRWVHDGPRSEVSLRNRLRAARTFEAPDDAGELIVLALGSPPMMQLARRLHRQGRTVRLDLSDSVLLQWRARLAAADPKLLAVGAWMIALHATSPMLPAAYISQRDNRADGVLNRLRPVEIIPASAPATVANLPAFRWPAQRVVCGGDFASFHNAAGLDLLCAAVRTAPVGIPVELFGPSAPARPLPDQVVYRGWAASTDQLLAGNSVAFISNRGGSGVPNKLCEAIAAGRPVIVHEELRDVVSQLAPAGAADVYWYDDLESLRTALVAVTERTAVAA
ncbi:GT2 family glycosyltransferase [Branchiibius hedensis]|uniref:Glycosyltransferase, GT2 family n=1 Tax=Branchiibius hedensis TaxID=672460 RepID=A0A2Y8ZNC8_9MICO|nr:glycosyltransferase family 2 protein [Branchiibius hedensis]PWJ25116.1 GT2 family glycosyltransferase [Branchiibius hedensis]SSA33931.1 Glycosyltransferase, GT2 family [Branchiibius hedensis]